MTQTDFVLDLLLKNTYVTALEIIEKSKYARLYISHPESPIAAIRKRHGGDAVKTRRAENIHNSSTHAQWYILPEEKKRIKKACNTT